MIKITNTAHTAETDGVAINLPVPLGVYDKLSVSALNASKQVISTVGSVSYVAATPEITWDCERATGVHLTAQALRPNYPMTLPTYVHGKFSVAANKKVWFASGNLVVSYHSTTNMEWAFEDNHWGYTASLLNGSNYQTDGQRISHFGWGTGNQPYKISVGFFDYPTYTEWGKHFDDLGNGLHSRTNGAWYTLSNDEWDYVFYQRPRAAFLLGKGMIFDAATGQSVNGLLLLQDDWECPLSCKFRPSDEADYCMNMYTTANDASNFDGKWADMEQAGAVFLPAAAFRSSSNFNASTYCHYWSSTGTSEEAAYHVYFVRNFVSLSLEDRRVGCPVRLVHE